MKRIIINNIEETKTIYLHNVDFDELYTFV